MLVSQSLKVKGEGESPISTCQFEIPILFLIFNRPETTQQVFVQIQKIKPKKLYVASDGPKNDSDRILCEKTRNILKQIDWDCELHIRFLDENLGGCDPALRSEISWFFENEEMGIILEDDCLPHLDFFSFCREMLVKYQYNEKIMLISGDNAISKIKKPTESYYFSRGVYIWGWASWRRAWNMFDKYLKHWPVYRSQLIVDPYFSKVPEYREVLLYEYDRLYLDPESGNWDGQWSCCVMMNGGLSIIPRENLITNIGAIGVHYDGENLQGLFNDTNSLGKIIHPASITPNCLLDTIRYRNWVHLSSKYYYALKLSCMLRAYGFSRILSICHPLDIGYFLKNILNRMKINHNLSQ